MPPTTEATIIIFLSVSERPVGKVVGWLDKPDVRSWVIVEVTGGKFEILDKNVVPTMETVVTGGVLLVGVSSVVVAVGIVGSNDTVVVAEGIVEESDCTVVADDTVVVAKGIVVPDDIGEESDCTVVAKGTVVLAKGTVVVYKFTGVVVSKTTVVANIFAWEWIVIIKMNIISKPI